MSASGGPAGPGIADGLVGALPGDAVNRERAESIVLPALWNLAAF